MTTNAIALMLLSLASTIIDRALKIREAAGQSKEWTADEEQTFDDQLKSAREGTLPHWKVEPDAP